MTEFVCTIKESGGDYSSLSSWEDAIECDLVSAATKVFGGSKTGAISDGDSVTLYRGGSSQGVTAICLHATGSQILVKDISNTSFSFQSGDQWRVDSSNYFQISDTGDSPSAVAKIDGTWINADTSAVVIDGWTTDANHYIKIYTTPEARHDGKWNTNKYRLETNNVDCITNYENYVRIDGLQIKLTTSTEQYAVWMRPGGTSEIRISNNIIRGVVSGGNYVTGINFWNSASGTVGKIWNNIIYGFKGNSTRVGICDWEADATLYIYNNTISDCYNGIYRYAGTLTAINNVVFNNVDDFKGTFSTCDHNASDDGDGTNAVDISPGANESDDWNDAFVDYANGDFHIKNTNSVLYNAGTNDPGSGLFSDDIDGDTRDSSWDIGADEYVAGGATEKNVSDTGSGSDAVSIKCQTSITDSGAGADIATILASMNLTDTGSGADTISITQLKSLLETGQGADIISLINRLSVTDTGSGSEVLNILYKIAITDSGAGSEIINILSQIALQETGTGTDAVDKQVQGDSKQVSDTGTGTDALSILAKIAMVDSGTGTEAAMVLVRLAVVDSGIGTEIINILSQILQNDSGSGTEALEILKQIAIADSGSVSSEALTVLAKLAITETGSGTDEIAVSGEGKFIQDSGSGSEALNILIEMLIQDSGIGSEILAILNQIALTDTSSGTDAITVIGQIALIDSGNGSEAIEILKQIAISDSGSATEALEILVQIALSETGAGQEALSVLIQLALSDAGSGADSVNIEETYSKQVNDSGSGSEVLTFATLVEILDSGIGADNIWKQKIAAAIAKIKSSNQLRAKIKSSNQVRGRIKSSDQLKAKIKSILNY